MGIETKKRIDDILNLIKKLDIPQSTYDAAVEKYENVGKYLEEKGIDADIYPLGSFSLGTVVRPYNGNDNDGFDLDVICQVNIPKDAIDPKTLKEKIESALEESAVYKSKLKKDDTCCTIEYADINNISFTIDIVSAVDEEDSVKAELKQLNFEQNQHIDYSIAIPRKKDGSYNWITNNPKGYRTWFEQINKPFLDNIAQNNMFLFDSATYVRDSIEEIPDHKEKSSLQRVIQILKRHRDVYFSKIKNGSDIRPRSIIISTIVASMAQYAPKDYNIFDLLRFVLDDFAVYSKRQILDEAVFSSKYKNKNIIERNNGQWRIENPVNAGDNLADSWNENAQIVSAFFRWTEKVAEDFLQSIDRPDQDFITALEVAMGSEFVRKHLDMANYSITQKSSPIMLSNNLEPKPWRK